MSTRKLVIAIDYGTSSSGAAYALFDASTSGDGSQVRLRIIRRWPHSGISRDASDKVPSETSYDASGQPTGYGFEIKEDAAHKLQWVKLLLEAQHFEGDGRTPNTERIWRVYHELNELRKTPVGVIAEYLTWLWGRIQDRIIELESDQRVFETSEVTIVMTVPASWSDQAKEHMRQAAQQAGIDAGGRVMKFQAEPEAAAIFGLKDLVGGKRLDLGDCVIICDLGGGTVDVVTYRLASPAPFSLEQVVRSAGDLCGSAFVNSEFECQLRAILGPEYQKLDAEVKAQIRDDFEYKIKRTYRPGEAETYSLSVPGLRDNEVSGVRNGKLHLDDAVVQACFESVMTQILMLIDMQRDELRANDPGKPLKGILLVGGFASSDYLRTRIKQAYPETGRIKVWDHDEGCTAVVRGAVFCEIARLSARHTTVKARLSSHNYGIQYQIGNQRKVRWLVQKGRPLQSTTVTESFLLRRDDHPWSNEDGYATLSVFLVKTVSDFPSQKLDPSVTPHVEISCIIPSNIHHRPQAITIAEGRSAWVIPIDLVLVLDDSVLSVHCRISGQDVGAAELRYKNDAHDYRSSRVKARCSSPSAPVFRTKHHHARDSSLSDDDDHMLTLTAQPMHSTAPGSGSASQPSKAEKKFSFPAGESAKSPRHWYDFMTIHHRHPKDRGEGASAKKRRP